ncbi:hypothetical protein [Flavobacterium sp. C4GT6]|uniref:hypothetical protein n=1 Tax=Flavobacterium sp. C4GT6 TaxID=3103818 RepID=UPI002ED4F10C
MKLFLPFLLFIGLLANAQKVTEYDLYVTNTLVNYTGKALKAIAINGTILILCYRNSRVYTK